MTTIVSKYVNQEEVDKAYERLSDKYGGKKEDYFGIAYIANKFDVPFEEAATFVAIGGTDYGIDGFYHDKNAKSIFLYTFRWSSDHMAFKEPLEKLGKVGMEKLFFDLSKSEQEHQTIIALKTYLYQNWKSIDRVFINFVFNGDPINAEQSKVLSFLREVVEDKRGLIDTYFNRVDRPDQVHDLIFQYVANDRSLGHVTSSRDSTEYSIDFADSLDIANKETGNELMVVFMPLANLYKMYFDLGERFFERNIRSGLDDGTMTNYQIKQSLREIVEGNEPAENFVLYHNGITMTAQKLTAESGTVRMVEPRILNGAQTIKILQQFVQASQAKTDPALLQDALANTKVMVRIIRSSDDAFLKRVTINNNRQNPIMPWNLRANDLVQLGFEEQFGKLGIYYERRENAYKNLTEEDLEAVGTEKGVLEIRKFAQTLLAMQGHIDRISEIKEVFENELWYADAFKDRYLEVDPRKFVLLYKVQYRLQSLIREIRNLGTEKYSYVPKAKNLLWCLSIQGIMNDAKFAKYVEQYGNSTAIEAGITELLKNMGTTKLRYILSDTFEAKKYKDSISDGKLSFLRTKAAFNDCMKAASSRFKWEVTYI
jgi:hypothetical protein